MIITGGLLEIRIEIQMNGDGFNGIVAIGLVGAFQLLTKYKLRGGALSVVIAAVFMQGAPPGHVILTVVFGNGRRSSSGHMILFYK